MLDYNQLNGILKANGIDLDFVDNFGGIEPKIKPLVITLNCRGFMTTGSCEGHTFEVQEKRILEAFKDFDLKVISRGEKGLAYQVKIKGINKVRFITEFEPYVHLHMYDDNQESTLEKIIRFHNSRNGVQWKMARSPRPTDPKTFRSLYAYSSHPLTEKQEDINLLAEDVFYRYLL